MLLMEIDRSALLPHLGTTIGVVERRHTLPILSNVLISGQSNEARLLATDLELQVATVLKDVKVGTEFSLTVAARKLFDIVRALPEGAKIRLESRDSQVVLVAGRSRFTLQTLPAADFPRMESAAAEARLQVPQKILKRLLQLTQFSMANQDIRYYLNGLLLVLEGESLRLVATDGHRLSFAEASLTAVHANRELIIPRKTVLELSKMLSDEETPVEIILAGNLVTFAMDGVELMSKVVDGKFPDYQRVIPTAHDKKLMVNRQAAIQSLQRAAILSNEKFRSVRLVLGKDSLKVISTNNEQEEAQEELEARYDDTPLDIGFNVTYLLDGLAAVNGDEATLAFSDPNSSMLLTSDSEPSFKYVVMPMRI